MRMLFLWTGAVSGGPLRAYLALGLALSVLWGGGTALAAGFEGPGVSLTVTRAADVLTAQDDAPCILEGHLVEKLPRRKNRYIFVDRSGHAVVEIENKVFGHVTVTPADKVRLFGHVDWNRKRPNEVEVDALAVMGRLTEQELLEMARPQPVPQEPGRGGPARIEGGRPVPAGK